MLARAFLRILFSISRLLGINTSWLPHAPELTEPRVTALVDRIVPQGIAIYLAVEPARFAEVNGCFPAVTEKVHRDGGSMVVGWQIWRSRFLLEAEYHAVWRAPDGTLRDITPKALPIDRILFVADPTLTYDGRQRDNVRLNMSDNPLGDQFIAIAEALFAVENRGERAFQSEVTLRDEEAAAHEFLLDLKRTVEVMIIKGLTPTSLCLCRGGLSYQACHGVSVVRAIAICQGRE